MCASHPRAHVPKRRPAVVVALATFASPLCFHSGLSLRVPLAPCRALAVDQEQILAIEAFRAWRKVVALETAAGKNDLECLKRAIDAGAELDERNAFGQSALFVAAWYGHAEAVRTLAEAGADPSLEAPGGIKPWTAAAAAGHASVLEVLRSFGVDEGPAASHVPGMVERHGEMKTLLDADSQHPGAGSRYLDDAVPEATLRRLDALVHELPVPRSEDPATAQAPGLPLSRAKARRFRQKLLSVGKRTSERRFYCDAANWIRPAVQKAVEAAGFASAKVSPWMRFLIYKRAGQPLKPHVDAQWNAGFTPSIDIPYVPEPWLSCEQGYAELGGQVGAPEKTSHSFLLYLTDCRDGETQLLEGMVPAREIAEDASLVSASCKPRRGRLLLFPHDCVHAAAPVASLPKLVLRGDVACQL
mmetsp:Transcript_98207/g.174833  ORF Transcript_98207/g.174833 Transcript_98207/m.174833 type:complete len:416 (-) Transcript_98207:114-1361(-)